MADYGEKYTDKELAALERKITKTFKEAEKDIQAKMDSFNKRYEAKEAIHQKEVDEGRMTQEEFDNWKKGQVFQSQQWQAKKDQVINTLHNANNVSVAMINNSTNGVFAVNANYAAYQMEHDVGINFGFGIFDTATVSRLIKDNPQLLPKWKINEEKDYVWNQKKLNNCITQGIIQGGKLDDIAKRVTEALCTQNKNHMKTFATTAMTGAQNAGRQYRMRDAVNRLGIEVEKQWMATLDSHTRDSHRRLDGETQPVDRNFSNGLRYPGDPLGAAKEVYNCRCTMVSDVKKYPSTYDRYDNIDGKPIGNMTYREWEKAKDIKPESNMFSISDKIRSTVTPLTASDDWFEYENANIMSQYIKTGVMPETDLYGTNIDKETRERLAAEAEIIQDMGSTTKTPYKTLYRGMVLDEDEARAISPGENYVFDTLSATTTNKGIADIYTNVENSGIENGVPVVFEIQKSDGIFGFDRDGTEVILPKGSEFKITRNWMDEDGKVHISLYAKKGKNIGGG